VGHVKNYEVPAILSNREHITYCVRLWSSGDFVFQVNGFCNECEKEHGIGFRECGFSARTTRYFDDPDDLEVLRVYELDKVFTFDFNVKEGGKENV